MKRFLIFSVLLLVVMTGCSKTSEKGILKNFKNSVGENKSYYLEGDLEIVNNDNVYNYDVEVSYKKGGFYKVDLVNTSNNHEQIILKNKDGVYVVTPSLNKSFKFQSDWPYNNSQIYLLYAILNDIESDKNREFIKSKNEYKFITAVNYPNNKKLVKQEIVFDKKQKLKQVKVYDDNEVALMTMKFKKIDFSPSFKNNHFTLSSVLDASKTFELTKEVNSIDDTIYPLVIPSGTKLVSEEKVKKANGERVIMTFDGEKPFLLVEETASVFDELTIVPTNGEPYMLQDTLGTLTNNSLTWTTGGMEYYLVSDVLSQQELVEIAQSISVLPTMK